MIFRLILAAIAAVVTAGLIERVSRRRGLEPPGFARPERRIAAVLILALVLFAGIFSPLAALPDPPEIDVESLGYGELFLLPLLLLGCLLVWYLCGFAGVDGVGGETFRRAWISRFGLGTRRPLVEVGLGLLAGAGAWMAVLLAMTLAGAALFYFGGEEILSQAQQPSELIVWLAGLPVAMRILLSLSAGLFEELFFRGFLQPRIGLLASTLLFVCGHVGYGQPFMLFGLTLLSLLYGGLVRLRGNIWAAVVAHALFDLVQLLVVIPLALEQLAKPAAPDLATTAAACCPLLGPIC